MITAMRKYFKTSVYQGLLWLIIIAFIGGLVIPIIFKESGSKNWALRVNGNEIDARLYVQELQEQRKRIYALRAQFGEFADQLMQSMGFAADPQQLAFNSLVRRSLVKELVKKLGIHISDSDVQQKLGNAEFVSKELSSMIPEQLITKQGIDWQLLQTYLSYAGLTMESFTKEIKQELAQRMAWQTLYNGFYIPEFEIKNEYMKQFVPKKYSILVLSYQPIIRELMRTAIADQELKAFFDKQNKQSKRYLVPEKRSGTIWTFTEKGYNVSTTEQEITSYYEQNKTKRFVKDPAQVQVRRIVLSGQDAQKTLESIRKQAIDNPERFADLAKQYSEDKQSAGGVVSFSRGQIEKSLEQAVFSLEKDMAISPVIETSKGKEILQRVSKTKPTYKSIEQVKPEIQKLIANKKAKELFLQDIRTIQDQPKEQQQSSLQQLSQTRNAQKQEVKSVTAQDPMGSLLFKARGQEIAYNLDEDKGVVALVTTIEPAKLPSFESVKEQVSKDYVTEKAQEKVAQLLNQIRVHPEQFDSIAQQYAQEVKMDVKQVVIKTDWVVPSKEEPGFLKEKGIPASALIQLAKPAEIAVGMTDSIGYGIKVDHVKPLDGEQWNNKKEELKVSMAESHLSLYAESIIASLYRNAKIEINKSIVHDIQQ